MDMKNQVQNLNKAVNILYWANTLVKKQESNYSLSCYV